MSTSGLRILDKSQATSSASGNQHPGIFIWPIASLLVILLLLGPCAVTCLAQASVEEFQNTLSAQAGLTADDWSALERGGVVGEDAN